MIRVFVYGTLKRGQPNHHLLENVENGKATFIGEGKTEKKYPLIIASRCNLPFLLNVEGTGKVSQTIDVLNCGVRYGIYLKIFYL